MHHIRKVIKTQHLPEYTIDLADNVVTFRPKGSALRKPANLSAEITIDSLDSLIEPKALELARKEAQVRNRDFYQLKAEFIEVMRSQGQPEKISGAFVGFVRSKSPL